jgi:hypothetical protein
MAIAMIVLGTACAMTPRPAATPAAVPGLAAADAEAASGDTADEPDDGTSAGSDRSDRDDGSAETEPSGPCPADMALVETTGASSPSSGAPPRRFCVDKYEASLVEVLGDGTERPFPHYVPVDGHEVRAISKPHAFPQGYVSEVQAQDACAASGKRLCNMDEWKTACMGPSHTTFPYGDARRPGACHDTGKSAVIAVFGAKAVAASTPYAPASAPAPVASAAGASGKRAHATKGRAAQSTRPRASGAKSATASRPGAKPASKKGPRHAGKKGAESKRPSNVDPGVWARLNDPGLGQVDGALAKTGEHEECVNGFGVFDMVGNLHEWVATDPKAVHGTFAGGYYLDTTINGDGCNYRTVAHAHDYHDYSTGFRCCAPAADAQPAPSASRGP